MITVATLRALPALADYADGELEVLLGAASARAFAIGTDLCREGAVGTSCFVLVQGEAEVLRASSDGDRHLARLAPGAVVGQIALVDRGPRSATVRATTVCVALELARDVFERLLAASSPLALRFQENIAVAGIRQLRAATARLATVLAEHEQRPHVTSDASGHREELAFISAATAEWGLSLDGDDAPG